MIELLKNRRSTRSFVERKIELEKIQILKEALLRSPSSRSINPWEFIFINDARTLQLLAQCKQHGASFLSGAPLAVIVAGDMNKSDTCIEDCSIAAITLQYTAESLGLASCWCQVRLREHGKGGTSEKYIKETVGIPGHYMIECIVALGYPAHRQSPHDYESLEWEKIKENRWG